MLKNYGVRIALGLISIIVGGSMFYFKFTVKPPTHEDSIWWTFFNLAGLYFFGVSFFVLGAYFLITSKKGQAS